MAYRHYRFVFADPDEEAAEILIARLAEYGFEGFWLNENELNAYTDENTVKTGDLDNILKDPVFTFKEISVSEKNIPDKNWNEEWEKSYDPIIIENICTIIAPFHQKPATGACLVIEPKMSFGTGHHQTTRLMIRHIYSVEMSGVRVLDMGCGTGVLGIFSLIQGAAFATAIDTDAWACENSRENFLRNGFTEENFEILQGNATVIPDSMFDIILANINRNVLLEDIPIYKSRLKKGGILVLSGILETDREVILEIAEKVSLQPGSEISEDKWISLRLSS
ncbi:MAG: 50S ribosomal protein L11 methyltransferase [Bacteroidales bacterium]|nr:50S ribosomal protein L11 methyltransferase [Bacteroidales bacterium]